jgi:hypothetical protein
MAPERAPTARRTRLPWAETETVHRIGYDVVLYVYVHWYDFIDSRADRGGHGVRSVKISSRFIQYRPSPDIGNSYIYTET